MSSAGSPPAYLLWSLLSTLFLVFLLIHLWSYDRFQCVRWNSGRQPGAFKRVMTYSYLGTVPLLVVFSIAMTGIKYKEGYIVLKGHSHETVRDYTTIPTPVLFWSEAHKNWLLPIYFLLSTGWSLELVTHLEELTFWLYLMHQGPRKRDWFHSWEFRVWYLGCMVAFLGMFCTTLLSRKNLETCAAWIFLVGGSASTIVTIIFLYVLARFPGFIRGIKDEGATPDVVVRLTTFYQLNLARVVFRFLFTVPLLVVGLDGIQDPPEILSQQFLPDFLFMLGGIGCFVSSAITLLVFFPRSVTREQGYKVKVSTPNPSLEKAKTSQLSRASNSMVDALPRPGSSKSPLSPSTSFRMSAFKFPSNDEVGDSRPRQSSRFYRTDTGELVEASPEYSSEDNMVYDEEDQGHSAISHDMQTYESAATPRQSLSPTPDNLETSPPLSYPRTPPHSPHTPLLVPPSPSYLPPARPELHLRRSATNSPVARSQSRSASTPQRRRPPMPSPRTSGSNLHPYVQNFTSPIDLLDHSDDILPRAL